MRELRTLGSMRGASGNRYPYRDPRSKAALDHTRVDGVRRASAIWRRDLLRKRQSGFDGRTPSKRRIDLEFTIEQIRPLAQSEQAKGIWSAWIFRREAAPVVPHR